MNIKNEQTIPIVVSMYQKETNAGAELILYIADKQNGPEQH